MIDLDEISARIAVDDWPEEHASEAVVPFTPFRWPRYAVECLERLLIGSVAR